MSATVIAIDGPAGSGKSTVARAVASALSWIYLDTGSMYRAVTVAARRHGLDITNESAMGDFAETVALQLGDRVLVNGDDVTSELRTDQTNHDVSVVATLARVRHAMVAQQRAFAHDANTGVVVEGRDITTVVFPDAVVKIFLTASLEERARRRGDEGGESVARRDQVDMSRAVSPLTQASDARIIDTTGRSIDDVVQEILTCLASNSN